MNDEFEKGLQLDRNWIKKIRLDKDSEAFEKLFNKYLPVALNAANRYHFRFNDRDDLIQEARIVCYKAALSYQLESHIAFGVYFQHSLLNYFCSLLRKENALKRKADKMAESLDVTSLDSLKKSSFAEPLTVPTALVKIIFKEIMEDPHTFSKSEYNVFFWFFLKRWN
ncbi:RNA polymerase sigma factor [Lactobacillus amylolyticus]|uniref:RNA polymerase sigma factor n=1 Tax=Lactobacillus amylolyticus TaxID=83683 RepID=UPI002490FD65|nr:sigma factor [Lactobacillus amylolyticus]